MTTVIFSQSFAFLSQVIWCGVLIFVHHLMGKVSQPLNHRLTLLEQRIVATLQDASKGTPV